MNVSTAVRIQREKFTVSPSSSPENLLTGPLRALLAELYPGVPARPDRESIHLRPLTVRVLNAPVTQPAPASSRVAALLLPYPDVPEAPRSRPADRPARARRI